MKTLSLYKMLNDVGMIVPKSIETRVRYADKGKDKGMINKVQYEAKAENNGILYI